MKIDTQPQDDHQIKLTVEVETETLDGAKKRAAKKIAKQVKIAGFRPGKAPYNVVLKQVGEAAILEDALDILLEDIYPKIIEETGIDPYGPGQLQNIESMEPPTFEFMVPLAPKVELGEYRELRIDYDPKEVTDKDIEQVVENLRENQAVIEPADRAAQEGDMVYVLLSGEKEEVEDEKDKMLVEERRFPVVIEKADVEDDTEWPFPGFSRKLIGLSADDEKTLKHKFTKDYEFEDLQGVKAVYQIKIEEVKARHLPDVDDEFAKSVGDYENVEDMRQKIEESLKENFENQNQADYQEKIVDALVEMAEIKYPPQMVDHEIDHYMDDLHHRLESQGLTMDLYLKSREIEEADLREEIKPNAEERLKRGLILMEVGNQEKIEVTQEEIQEKTQQALMEINQYFPPEEARKLSSGDALQGLVSRIVTDEITQRTLERLRKIAKGEPIEEETEDEEEEPSEEDAGDEPAKEEPKAEEPAAEEETQPEAETKTEEASAE